MTQRILDIDPLSGAVETFEWDHSEDRAIIRRIEDVEPVIEANKREQNSGHNGYTPSKDMRKAATVPVGVIYEWLDKYGVNFFDRDHWPAVQRLLNSNEYRYLRTAEFIV